MSDERMWYYMDSTGTEFGPYPSSTMRGWFQQGFFPMQGELKVRTDETPPDYHYLIRDLYGEPIRDTAFDGEPNFPGQKPRGAYGNRGGGGRGGGGGAGGARPYNPMANPLEMPYDMGAAAALAMPWMMPGAAAMPGGGMPFSLPSAQPGFPGFPGMPMMPGAGAATGRFQGSIKSFNVQKGFGFIECPEAHQIYGRDVFLHKAQIGAYQIGSQVSFAVEMNKTNMPQARDLVESDMSALGYAAGMPGLGFGGAPMGGAPGGKGGYGNQKGGGKGKSGGGKNNKPKGGGKGGDNKKGDNKKSGGAGGPGGAGGKPASPPQQMQQQPQMLPPPQ